MKTRPGSIKGRFFFWSLLITSTLLIVLGVSLYLEIRKSILHSVEDTLHSQVQILKGLLHDEHGMIELELTEVVSGEYAIPRSGHYYKVVLDDEVLAASPSLVNEDFDLESGKLLYGNELLHERVYTSLGPANEQVMVVRHDFMIFGQAAVIYAAQSLTESIQVLHSFRNILYLFISLNIAVLALAGVWIIRHSVKPLAEFSSLIERITHKTMGERIAPESQVDEIRNIAKSFNAMLDRLQEAFETEERLIADASHELKTPLSVIKAQCEVLLQRDRTKEEYAKALTRIRNTADSMKKLITDMLSLTRLDSGILSSSDFSPVSLHECIERAIKFTEFAAAEKGIAIEKNIPRDITIMGDQDALVEMFLNIIDNALKYSDPGGKTGLSLMSRDRGAEVEIRDNGKGIREEDMPRVFDRFFRAGSTRNVSGTGLGLSIAKAIAEAHGGTISATSEAGKGSIFIVTLPSPPNLNQC